MIHSILAFTLASPALAQDLELPVLSPRATVSQQIGTVEVTVDYSSPGKRDRTIWGDLVPYGELWRTGANAATTLETTGDLEVGGKEVPAGTYSVFTLPGEDTWTVILNQDPTASTGGYDESKDQARFEVKPVEGPDRERLTFLFSDTDADSATLQLEWAGVSVPIALEVDTKGRGEASIDRFVSGTSRALTQAARFRAEHGDVEGGLQLVEKALAVEETWYATWAKAELLKQQGEAKEAYKAAKQAMELGEAAGNGFFYKDRVEKALAEWPKR